jgi:hypothetical protein
MTVLVRILSKILAGIDVLLLYTLISVCFSEYHAVGFCREAGATGSLLNGYVGSRNI